MAKGAKARQAKTEGQVRYGPQRRLLKQMLKDVQAQFASGLAGEQSAYQALVDSARQAQPEMQGIYDSAAGVASRALTPAAGAPDLNGLSLGPGAAPYLGAASRDASATQLRLAQQLQMARGELTQRELRAGDARQFAVNKLASDTADQASKIRQQQSGLSSDETAFVSQRLGELLKEQADRSFTASEKAKDRDVSLATAGVDASGQILPGGKADPKATGKGAKKKDTMLAPEGNHAALTAIDKAEAQLRALIRNGRSQKEAAQVLREGRDEVNAYPSTYTINGKTYQVDPQTGTVLDGNEPLKYPGTTRLVKVDKAKLPKMAQMDPLYVRAALDRLIYKGRYRKSTLQALKEAGVSVPATKRKRPVSRKQVRQRNHSTGSAISQSTPPSFG